MPRLTELFILNFLAYVLLGVAFVIYRRRASLRLIFDALLILVSAATLYAWNALGRPDPLGTGSMALVVELALIVLAGVDAILVARRGALRAQPTATGIIQSRMTRSEQVRRMRTRACNSRRHLNASRI